MPELPEVEIITRQLNQVLPGKVIQSVEVLRQKSFAGEVNRLTGYTIESIQRKQKMMAVTFVGSDVVLTIHLKMTGQLIFQPAVETMRDAEFVMWKQNIKYESRRMNQTSTQRIVGGHPTRDWVSQLPSKHTRVIVRFIDGSALYFNDQRVFGWLKVVDRTQMAAIRKRMPPDVIDRDFTTDYLVNVLKRSSRPVKLVILDQNKIGGMGNIYANDALYIAKIHPQRPANTITPEEAENLRQAMIQVINKGIDTGGASYSHYVGIEGIGGHYQEHFLVYDQEGKPCPTCRAAIEKVRLGGRGTYFCPCCQR